MDDAEVDHILASSNVENQLGTVIRLVPVLLNADEGKSIVPQ